MGRSDHTRLAGNLQERRFEVTPETGDLQIGARSQIEGKETTQTKRVRSR